MYLDHYGLREAPFRLTPLTDFFFSGAQRGKRRVTRQTESLQPRPNPLPVAGATTG